MGRNWTKEEIAYLKKYYPDCTAESIAKALKRPVTSVYHIAHKYKVEKSEEFKSSPESGRLRGDHGKSTRFKKGQEAWNKGMKGLNLGGEAGYFKPGHKPHNTKSDGVITTRNSRNKYGKVRCYKWIRISEGVWRQLHVVRWEETNGPVPPGFIVVFADGNSMNCDISNLRLINRKQHAEETRNSDGFIASKLAHEKGGKGNVNREMVEEYLKHPGLIQAKRQQLKLNRIINEKGSK